MNKKRVLAIIAIVAIVAIMTVCLCACNAESITKKLEKKGYKCVSAESDDKDATVAWSVTGTTLSDTVAVTKYNNTDDAKKAEANAPTVSALGKKLVCKRVGNVVFYGTEQGVKDAM